MGKITYEIKKKKGDDVTSFQIIKKGAEIPFTLAEMLGYQEQMATMLKETRAQMDLEIAKMKNVEDHHDDALSLVKSLDPVKQKAIQIWINSKIMVDALGPKKDQIVEAIKADQKDLEEILKQTGLTLPESYKPVELNGTPEPEKIKEAVGDGDPVSGESTEG